VLVLTLPDNGPRIAAALRDVAGTPDVVEVDGVQAAVAKGARWVGRGGVVLLSPAAPSFGRFTDYRDRARTFTEAMLAIEA
jgi:UDP-N-acetylmuramoylalanine-D-glutamate ligase